MHTQIPCQELFQSIIRYRRLKSHFPNVTISDDRIIGFEIFGNAKVIIKTANKVYEIAKGQGFLIEPETVVSYISDEKKPWTYMWIGFSGARAEKYLADIGLHSGKPVFQCEKIDELKKIILKTLEAK